MEEQLIARNITRAELDKAADVRQEQSRRISFLEWLGHPVGELCSRLPEHGVVNVVLGIEIGIDGRSGDARPAGEVP